jgi:hypothetical protein
VRAPTHTPFSVFSTSVILIVVALVTFFAFQNVTRDLILNRQQEITYLAESRLREELSNFSEVLIQLASTPDIYRLDQFQREKALMSARQRLAVFDGGVVLLNNFGVVDATSPDLMHIIGQDWSDRDYFRLSISTEHTVFDNMGENGLRGTDLVVIAVPVRSDTGEYHVTTLCS